MNLTSLRDALATTSRRLVAGTGAAGAHRAATDIVGTIDKALASAGLNTGGGGPAHDVLQTVRRALASAGIAEPATTTAASAAAAARPAASPAAAGRRPTAPLADVIDVAARVVPRQPGSTAVDDAAAPSPATGRFTDGSYANAAGTRSYKLYVPANLPDGAADRARPLLVMLHGCKQNPADFAAGTQMNALADRHGFLVVYPAQAAHANGSNCWNWFKSQDQQRDAGEPSLIAGIVRQVITSQPVDERRIYVAGLSAGASMAVILGATYPDLFAAVGAHSGLPYGAAHDMPSAFAAMSGGGAPGAGAGGKLGHLGGPPGGLNFGDMFGAAAATPASAGAATRRPVPTIVFHGDRDSTVNPANGAAIVAQALAAASAAAAADGLPEPAPAEHGSAAGRTYTRSVYADAAGRTIVEHWVLHGAAHAWAGGSPLGSYTDASGPDASAEMVRFFLATRRAG